MAECMWLRRMCLVAVMGAGFAVPALGQSLTSAVKTPLYDAVSIKPNKSANNMVRIMTSGGRFSATGVSIKSLMLSAYDVRMEQQISGITGLLADARFDIEAKIDEGPVLAPKKLTNEPSADPRRQ